VYGPGGFTYPGGWRWPSARLQVGFQSPQLSPRRQQHLVWAARQIGGVSLDGTPSVRRLSEYTEPVHLPRAGHREWAHPSLQAAWLSAQPAPGCLPADGDRIDRPAAGRHVLHDGVQPALFRAGEVFRSQRPPHLREPSRCGGEIT
jgi:hypothetical protein